MTTANKAFLALLLFAVSAVAESPSLLEARFLRPDVEALSASLKHLQAPSAERLFVLYTLADFKRSSGEIHQAEDYEQLLQRDCSKVEQEGATRAICLLSETSARASEWELAKSEIKDLNERLYVEGIVLSALPDPSGANGKKAMVAFHMLKRARPDISNVDLRIGRLLESRGSESAVDYYEMAANKPEPDTRVGFYYNKEEAKVVRQRNRLDGEGFGFKYGASYSVEQGFGGKVEYFDDNVFDKAHRFNAVVFAATRPSFSGAVAYSHQIIPGLRLDSRLRVEDRVVDYFGLGPSTTLSDKKSFRSGVNTAAIGFRREVNSVSVLLGWRADILSFISEDVPEGVLPYKDGNLSGPTLSVAWDTRDSRNNPTKGYLVGLEAYFPTRGLGSSYTMEQWETRAQGHFLLFPFLRYSMRFDGMMVRGETPIALYPSLARNVMLPAVRPGRFQAAKVLGFTPSVTWFAHPLMAVEAFATFGGLGEQSTNLDSLYWMAGFGGALEFRREQRSASSVRLETGMFRNEVVVRATAGTRW